MITTATNFDQLAQLSICDFSFLVASELRYPFDDNRAIVSVAPSQKRYGFDVYELKDFMDRADSDVFLFWDNGRAVGYIVVSSGWNGFAIIEDIAVDLASRGKGVAKRLLDAASRWARKAALAGLRLETQSSNVVACNLYKSYGFALGGYDRLLYSQLGGQFEEVALFWYLVFKDFRRT